MSDTRIDREQWSQSSKQSYEYELCSEGSYGDLHYNCAKCGAAAVFTAEEQKHSFEVKKNDIRQQRIHCPACNAELFRLRTRERACQARWSADRKTLARDEAFLREWLGILVAIPRYAPRYRNSMGDRLARLLLRLGLEMESRSHDSA